MLLTSPEPVPSSSPPRNLRAVAPKPVTPCTTQASSPSPQSRSRARTNIVLPESTMLCTLGHSWARDTDDPRHPRAYSAVILPEPTMSRAPDAVEPTLSLSPQRHHRPQARNATLYIFLCHFGPIDLDFDMLHCFCSTALFWCATLSHWFDILHCL
jgi:hypothetical protein